YTASAVGGVLVGTAGWAAERIDGQSNPPSWMDNVTTVIEYDNPFELDAYQRNRSGYDPPVCALALGACPGGLPRPADPSATDVKWTPTCVRRADGTFVCVSQPSTGR